MDIPAALADALVGAYRIERELTGGGMSRVFVARDLVLERDVVVKMLADDGGVLSADRFRQEIQLLAKLQHPNIIPVLSSGTAGGQPFYVMPFVEGESLRAHLATSAAVPIDRVVRILDQVLAALEYAHARGVVHRDIKPDNILLSAGVPVLADFGIAKALSAAGLKTTAGIALGTPTYMAPEQAVADPGTDHRADLYALGAVAFEMLTGRPPFTGSPQDVVTAHLTQPAPAVATLRPEVPAALAAVVDAALAKRPADRPQSASAMRLALAEQLTPSGAQARIAASATLAHRTTTATRWGLWLVPGLAALAGVVWLAGGLDAFRPGVAKEARALAVLPFTPPSGDSTLVRLGADLANTTALTLDGIGGLTIADPSAAITLAQKATQPLTAEAALEVARRLGSSAVLTGSIARDGDRVRLDLLVRNTGDAEVLARTTVTGPAADLSTLTDSLTLGVLRAIARRGVSSVPSLATVTTGSVPALRAFLDGERRWAAGDIAHADSFYREAATIDTTFVLAAYRYRQARTWFGRSVDPALRSRLLRDQARLPERERAIVALDTVIGVRAQLAARRTLTMRYPDYGPAWMLLGDYQLHWAGFAGDDPADALPALKRWAELMPDDATAIGHVGYGCLVADSVACITRVRRELGRTAAAQSAADGSEGALLAQMLRLASDSTLTPQQFAADAELRRAMVAAGYYQLGLFAQRPWAVAAPRGGAPATMPSPDAAPTELSVAWVLAQLAGTPALEALDDYDGFRAAPAAIRNAGLGELVGLALSEQRPLPAFVPRLIDRLAADTTLPRPERRDAEWHGAMLRLSAGDTSGVGRFLREADTVASERARVQRRILAGHRDLVLRRAGAIDSLLAVIDAQRTRVGFLPSLPLARWLVADSLLARGQHARLDTLTRYAMAMPGSPEGGLVISTAGPSMLLARARALEQLGRQDAARSIARGMLALFDGRRPSADPLVAAYTDLARRLGAAPDAAPATRVPARP